MLEFRVSPSGTSRRPDPGRWATAAASVGAVALVFTATDDDGGLVVCPWRRCTGGYCPGCGGTRAARHLLTGDVAGAWRHHPMVVLLAAQILVIGAVMAPAVVRSGRLPSNWRAGLAAFGTANAALAMVIWIARLTDGSIPTGWL